MTKKSYGEKLETAPKINLDDAVLFTSKHSSPNTKQKSAFWKHEAVQTRIKYTLEDYKYCLEKFEIQHVVN